VFSDGVLVFDGGIGTELYERGFFINRPFEELNLSAPTEVVALHRTYLEAGADIITTNTFSIARTQLEKFDIGDQQSALLKAALRNANQAVRDFPSKKRALISLSVGPLGLLMEPLGPTSKEDAQREFALVAQAAQDSGENFDIYNLETFTNLDELESAVNGIRHVDTLKPILASVSAKVGQRSFVEEFAARFGNRDDVTALGLNCSEGPSEVLSQLKILRPLCSQPLVVRPNAGIPRQINGRYFYMTSPDYLAKFAKRFVEAGAAGVGGCCGTGPHHVKAIYQAVRMMNSKSAPMAAVEGRVSVSDAQRKPKVDLKDRKSSRVGQALLAGKKVVSIELLSPRGLQVDSFFEHLDQIDAAGIEFVNVPDGPRASTRIGSLHLAAAVLQRRPGKISVIPHFTTRDRNLIALQADLLGAALNNVSDVLLVTGDPPKLGNNPDATGVYDIDSIGLTFLLDCLNRGVSPSGDVFGGKTSYGIGVAANPTSDNLELELKRWRYKVEMGADFAVTQPIYDSESFYRWLDLMGQDSRPQLVGVWPFVSLRNAEFMANEVPGVFVPQWALEEMAKAGDDKVEAAKRGVGIAQKVMRDVLQVASGFCISAPLGRVDLALETFKAI
jgi:methionine synthase / methylenetetrahydrofolate reductase(NADPH)